MAKMYPDLGDSMLAQLATNRSRRAEILVYRALRALPERVLVRYRVPWVSRDGVPADGEADFVVFDPRHGILAIEVKGGGIHYDAAKDLWTSTDRDGVVHELKPDPFTQATRSVHELHRHLRERPEWKAAAPRFFTLAHAAIFPDLTRAQCTAHLRLLQTPPALVGTHDDLAAIAAWLDTCFRHFARANESPIGDRGVSAAESILCRDITIRPLLAREIEDEEHIRLTLTEQQRLTLELLDLRSRVGISGGAGTGKTLLARTKAERLAASGQATLLLCFNKPLAAHLARSLQGVTNIKVCTLHHLYTSWIAEATQRSGRDMIDEAEKDLPGKDRSTVILPHAFMLAVMEIGPPPFNAVIVDEGQDFRDEDWTALSIMLESDAALACWIFFDPNQTLYRRSTSFPFASDAIFPLHRNCRNTEPIHTLIYRRYHGDPVTPPGIAGVPVEQCIAATLAEQAKVVQRVVRRHLEGGISAADIVVLVLPTDERRQSFLQPLHKTHLPDGIQWSSDVFGDSRHVLVDTVARFKGLEATILILWLGVDIDVELHREFLYVGTSRGRSRLILVGTEQVCTSASAEC